MKRLTKSILIIACSLLGVLLMSFLSNPVTSISGTVSKLNNELLEYVNPEKPTHDHSAVYYQRFYVSKFNLGDRAIEAKFSSPMKIHEGDLVTVAGYPKNNVFQVLAYSNKTQQVSGNENWLIAGLGALFFLAVAIGLLNTELVMEGAWIPRIFLIGFVAVAIYMGYRALLIREALKLMQN